MARPLSRLDHQTLIDWMLARVRITRLQGRIYAMHYQHDVLVRANATEAEWRWWTLHGAAHVPFHRGQAHVCGYRGDLSPDLAMAEEQADLLTGFLLLGDPEPDASSGRMQLVARECGVPLHRVIAWNQRQELIW